MKIDKIRSLVVELNMNGVSVDFMKERGAKKRYHLRLKTGDYFFTKKEDVYNALTIIQDLNF